MTRKRKKPDQDKINANLEKRMVFGHIAGQIRYHRTGFSKDGRDYIDRAYNLLHEIEREIEQVYQNGGVTEDKYLNEIIQTIGAYPIPGQSPEQAAMEKIEHGQEFVSALEHAVEEGSVAQFYETWWAKNLLDLCQNLSNIYNDYRYAGYRQV